MTFKYYTFHRPVDIGTYPTRVKPTRIENYPEGMRMVTAADGRTFRAWGEIEYPEPLTEHEVYSFELKRDYEYPPFRRIGYWMGDVNGGIEIIRIEGRYFALFGWNGVNYGYCWECKNNRTAIGEERYTLTPVYVADTEAGQAMMETMSEMEADEWAEMMDKLNEIVSYKVERN